MMYNPMEINYMGNMDGRHPRDGRGHHRDGRFNEAPEAMPRGNFGHAGEGFHTLPRDFDDRGEGFRCMPRGHGGPGGHGFGPGGFGPGGFGPGGFGPGGFGPGGFGPGGFGPGGMPPRRPDPQFLKRRIDESDLMELIDMAGRMAQRRPQGGPAKSQALVLSILAGRDTLSQRELQQMLGIQPGSLSELLSKLEGKGYLIREKAEDRRGNLLRITEEGRKAIPIADDQPEDDPLAVLTDDQQDQLAALLRTLLNHWVDKMEVAGPRARRTPVPHHERPVEL